MIGKSKFIIAFLCLPVIWHGINMCWQGNDDIQKAKETHNWYKTTGTISYSKVSDAGVDPSPGKVNKSSIARIHRPVIKYNYLVNNIQYQSSTIYFGDDNARNVVSYADEVVAKYRLRQQAVVYYHPRQPSLSVLEPGASETTFLPLTYGLILIVGGICIPSLFFIFSKLSKN
jgi:Protein of unknown function (DUF3592)